MEIGAVVALRLAKEQPVGGDAVAARHVTHACEADFQISLSIPNQRNGHAMIYLYDAKSSLSVTGE